MLILNKIDYLLLKKKLDLNTSYVDIKPRLYMPPRVSGII